MQNRQSQGSVAATLLAVHSGINTSNGWRCLVHEHFRVVDLLPRDLARVDLCDLCARRPPNNSAHVEATLDRKRSADLPEVRI